MNLFENTQDAFKVLPNGDRALAKSGLADTACEPVEFCDQLLSLGEALVEPA